MSVARLEFVKTSVREALVSRKSCYTQFLLDLSDVDESRLHGLISYNFRETVNEMFKGFLIVVNSLAHLYSFILQTCQ